jgi:hypothetical protein
MLTGGLPSLVGRFRAGERLKMRRGPIRVSSDDPLVLAASWANVGNAASEREQRRAQLTWLHAAGRPAAQARTLAAAAATATPAGPSAGALPLAAIAVSSPAPAPAPPLPIAASAARPDRAVCPNCLVWHPLEEIADGCPQCGSACMLPPRIAQPSAVATTQGRVAAR